MKKRADGRYQKRITLPNGKSKLLYSTANTEREAVKDFNRQMLALEDEHEKSLNFDSVAEQWATEHFPTLELNTLKSYKPSLQQAIEYFDTTPIADIEVTDITAYIDDLKKKDYAKKTIKERLALLKQIFKYAILNKYIKANPCQYVKVPKDAKPSVKREAATQEEENIIKNISCDVPFGYFAKFLLFTGCRRGEALALTPSDIDYQNHMVRINKTVIWDGNKPQIKPIPKTEAGERFIPIPDIIFDELIKRKSNKLIFPNEENNLYKNHEVEKTWNELRKKANISCSPHQLRHSFTTMIFDAGIDVKTAQSWLGHKDIKTTLEIYTHLSERRREQSVAKWFDFVQNTVLK